MEENSHFDFYEKVRVVSGTPDTQEVNGETGVVLGKSHHENGNWSYAVYIYRDSICWMIDENEMETLGELDESFYVQD